MIRIVDDIEEKQRIARSILTALPEWFGIPESTENYIRESANEIMVASFEEEKANGFLCLKETGKDTVELAVMGVLKTHHRKGIGRDMFDKAKRIAAEHMAEQQTELNASRSVETHFPPTRRFSTGDFGTTTPNGTP